jgi:hypothetical protein
MFMHRRSQFDTSEKWAYSISFLDVLSAVPPFYQGTARGRVLARILDLGRVSK